MNCLCRPEAAWEEGEKDACREKRRWKGYLCCLIITAFLSGGCGRQENIQEPVSQEPIIHFKGVILGTPPEGGMAEVYEQLDALTIPELNCTLRFEFIPWGNEREQLNIAVASGEYDFCREACFPITGCRLPRTLFWI